MISSLENSFLKSVKEAREILKDHCLVTPLVHFPNEKISNITVKAECLQPSGSFKIRGATYCLSKLSPEQLAKGVVAYSTGNHAQAVALAAKRFGAKATIVMSPDVKDFKIRSTKKLGADVIFAEPDQRIKTALDFAASTGAYFIPPFDHEDILIGQGTIGLEILDEMEPEFIFVPVGGGGLIAGIAMAVKKINPNIKIIGVEPELENDAWQSFKTGKKTGLKACSQTVADAVRIPMLGDITFPIISKYVDDIITVTELQIKEALLRAIESTHLFLEPSGAISIAGALAYAGSSVGKKPIVCIGSGGNTTIAQLCSLSKVN